MLRINDRLKESLCKEQYFVLREEFEGSMVTKMKYKVLIITLFFCMAIIMLNSSSIVSASGGNERLSDERELEETEGFKISNGETDYGAIYGAPYSEADTSEWLTLQLGGRGLRIVNSEGNDVVLVDQFGGVYINGQLCSPNSDDNEEQMSSASSGLLYFLVIVSLILGVANVIMTKKDNMNI